MWSRRIVAWAVLALVVALVPIARADDPPGLALAKQVVEELRGDAHRQKMRIVWPEHIEETPPEGAEVVLITGYIDYTLTRLVWHAGKVEARTVTTTPFWSIQEKGWSFSAREFDVEPGEFAKAWSAARHVVGGHEERVAPKPATGPESCAGYGGRAAADASREYVRMRLADNGAPLHVSDHLGSSRDGEGLPPWDEIRDRVCFRLFEPFIGKRKTRGIDLASLAGFVLDEIRRATAHTARGLDWFDALPLTVALRVAGEAGGVSALDAVDQLDAALSSRPRDDWDAQEMRERLDDEIEISRTKVGLRVRWDSAIAERLLRDDPQRRNWQRDLEGWIRPRFREHDPAGYLALAVKSFRVGAIDGESDVLATLAAIRKAHGSLPTEAARRLLTESSAPIRVEAARTLLAFAPADADATSVLLAVIDDPNVPIARTVPEVRWCRVDALNAAVESRILVSKDLRKRLVWRPDHAFFIRALLDALTRLGEPATRDEELAAWRRVLEGPLDFEVRTAVRELIALKDTTSRGRIVAALDRLEQEAQKSAAARTVAIDADVVEALRRDLDARIPAEPGPK